MNDLTISDIREMPDMHEIQMWILWNGMGGTGGYLHFYRFDGNELVFGPFCKTEQTELINKLILLPNGDETTLAYKEPHAFSGFSSGERVGFWGIEKAHHDNYLFFRESKRNRIEKARPNGICWVAPMDWVRLFKLEEQR